MTYHHYSPQNAKPQQNRIQPVSTAKSASGQSHSHPQNIPLQSAKPVVSQKPPHPKARPIRRPAPSQKPVEKPKAKKKLPLGKGINGLLHGILPGSVYNPDSKKIFGMFSAEDLLLVALIFLCAESDEEDNSMMILALFYILLSDYIELPDLSF